MRKYVIKYPPEAANKPVLAEAILKTGVLVNILITEPEYKTETLVISVVGDAKAERRFLEHLSKEGLESVELKAEVLRDNDRCVDCCACFGVCPTKAISIVERKMVLDNDECIRCGACVEACPTRALKLKGG
ncbi:MAG: 4Fe-4S binding protein [Candidatus Altiarchaeota archaeon]